MITTYGIGWHRRRGASRCQSFGHYIGAGIA